MEIVPPADIGTEPLRHHNKSTTPTTNRLQYHQSPPPLPTQSTRLQHHHHHHHHHHNHSNQSYHNQLQQHLRNSQLLSQQQQQQKIQSQPKEGGGGGSVAGKSSGSGVGGSSFDSQAQSSMAYQHKHALHRLRRLKKRAPHRDLVISFVPRLRISIINRLDFFHRYSKQEQEVLSCFDFLDELVLNYCDGGLDSPRYSQKLYETMIYELI